MVSHRALVFYRLERLHSESLIFLRSHFVGAKIEALVVDDSKKESPRLESMRSEHRFGAQAIDIAQLVDDKVEKCVALK